ncbi:hypothetical protein XMD530_001396 [Marinobacterium sp. xm-d-530]|nr:hypothetical protein [Marinobacterium sp. xm-d-530]
MYSPNIGAFCYKKMVNFLRFFYMAGIHFSEI